ncbi:MAG: ribosomal protein S18-alanine N-acetyltransferase [Candidatus Baldrarchaeia archaeon]
MSNKLRIHVSIRNANLDDLFKIYLVEKSSFDRPYSLDTLRWIIASKNSIVLVAEIERKIVGYVAGLIKGSVGHIVSIAVHPNFRGLGIGRKLLLSILEKFSELRLSRALLEVAVDNDIAIYLYKSSGFRVSRRLRNYYGDGLDAFLMVLDLGDTTTLLRYNKSKKIMTLQER